MEIPTALLADAELMVQSLLDDLAQIPELSVNTCRDDRLPPLKLASRQVSAADDVKKIWKQLMRESDLAWIIAPETNNELLELSRLAQTCDTRLVSSSDEAIKLTSSKIATYRTLRQSAYLQPETRLLLDEPVPSDSGWVVKPDMGAGGEHCYFCTDLHDFKQRFTLPEQAQYFVQQPFLQGTHLSLSVAYTEETTVLLSCNGQEIVIEGNKLINRVINHQAVGTQLASLQELAENIRETIPGLRAYVGIDLVVAGDDVYILDINPRLTSSYAGLSASLGYNVAAFIIEEFGRGQSLLREIAN